MDVEKVSWIPASGLSLHQPTEARGAGVTWYNVAPKSSLAKTQELMETLRRGGV